VWSKVILATLMGSIGGSGLTLLYNRFDDVIETPDDLSRSADGLFGAIPEWTATTAPAFDESSAPWPGIADPFSPAAESYRHLATNIRLGLPHNIATIVVTSPGAQEGKTTTSANLAVALTEAGKDVLLVDADLQGPTLHRLFNADRTPGLTDRLSNESDAVQLLDTPHLHLQNGESPTNAPPSNGSLSPTEQQRGRLGLLAAGSDVPQPALLLQERHLQPLLQSLEPSWDIVLIDTPPALLYDDAFRLASLSDLVLLLATAHQTRRRAVQEVRTRLDDLCPHTIATVLNRDPSTAPSTYGYTSSSYPSRRDEATPTDRLVQTVSRGVRRVMKG
jgi:Mrp family chromosome partitioning ATPase